MDYQPGSIEPKWRKYWEDHKVYKVENNSDKPKYYVLDMFPYPSGAGLHVGHPTGYIASDIAARYKRLKGFNVLHPMGYDAFGLPAEQYAIQTGVHPEVATNTNIETFRRQLDNLGFSYDWDREVKTCDPKYYRWTQEIFTMIFDHYYCNGLEKALPIANLVSTFEQEGNAKIDAATTQETIFTAEEWKAYSEKEQSDILMNYRLAYRKESYVNWCEALGTVLANDEVKDGVSERGGHPVVKKAMLQWALRITAYSERLLQGLETVDFSEALKQQQRNWIGKSIGAQVFFDIANSEHQIEIFTTRPDTIFGATFMVLAPEHPFVQELTTTEQKEDVDAYIKYASSRSELDRMAETKKVTGAFTGAYAEHPFIEGKQIPIWISEYVLIGYGTGAIMAVPSNDERDERFANHFGIDIIPVIDQSEYPDAAIEDKIGKLQNSGFLNGLEVKDAIKTAIQHIADKGIGDRQINYRLRDANFSRQRYWGEPFPIMYKENGVPVVDQNLPLELPKLDNFKPTASGQSPLARATDWVKANGMTRELDTMPGYAGSSWYFLRYMDANNDDAMFSEDAVNYWQDVDLYVGGAEHAVGHLMYSRFWHKFLYDINRVPTKEPYKKLLNQGMIQGVIEFVYMLKEKRESKTVFVSADLVENDTYNGIEAVKIPIYIGFVQNYGSDDSYLDAEGMKALSEWREDYNEAIFDTNDNGQVVTVSEVGKMSKSKHNVINPDTIVEEYGTDCFRMYEMFLGPITQAKPWDTKGIIGVAKFLRRLWALFYNNGQLILTDEQPNDKELKALHTAIKNVNHGLENLSFNTCVSDFMKAVNDLKGLKCAKRAILQDLVILIAPFAPHVAEELWVNALGNEASIHVNTTYPIHDEKYLKEDSIEYPIQVGKKVRARLSFPTNASKDDIEAAVRAHDDLNQWIDGKTIRKIIVVPKRLVNIVAN